MAVAASRESSGAKRRRLSRGKATAAHPASAVGSAADLSEEEDQDGPSSSGRGEKEKGAFRFWFDERRFKGAGARCIVQRALFNAGGVRTGGHPKASPLPGPLGWERSSDWDMLWSPARLALKAVPSLKPGQLVSACPGILSLTKKRRLPATLKEAYGDKAWQLMPRSFMLPEELGLFKSWIASQPGAAEQLWILKTPQHLGKGLRLLQGPEAVREAAKQRKDNAKPYVLAQQYVENPLLIDGRKFGIRVWALVTGHDPLRVYLHGNGLVLFSTNGYDSSTWSQDDGEPALGHVTNYAQNVDGTVWDLHQLQQHLGDEPFRKLWSRIANNVALLTASALGNIKADHAMLKVPHGATFELLGLDYLIDTDLQPWLLEANGTPSLAVDHSDPKVEAIIRTQKGGMVEDMVSLLNCPTRFKARYDAMRLTARTKQQQAQQAQANTASSSRLTTAGSSSASDDTTISGAVAAAASSGGAAGSRAVSSGTAMMSAVRRAAAATTAGSTKESAAASLSSAQPSNGVGSVSAAQTLANVKLAKKLREQLMPTSDATVMGVVADELKNRGGFAPLMPLFPYDGPMEAGYNITWDKRDYDLQAMLQAEMAAQKEAKR